MAVELREQMLGQADQAAASERAGIEYLVGLIEEEESALREAFIGPEEEVPDDDIQAVLYKRVSKTIDELSSERTRPFGVMLYYRPLNSDAVQGPASRMGWVNLVPALQPQEDYVHGTKYPHVERLTEKGVTIIDGLRTAKGLLTLAEQAQANRSRWDRVISSAVEAESKEGGSES